MKTKPTKKATSKTTPAPSVQDPQVTPPAPALPPELDIEPWKVITIQSKPRSTLGKITITITSKLQYRGRTMLSAQGAAAQGSLQALANQYNASAKVPIIHKKAFADLSETARASLCIKLGNTCP